MKFFLSLGFVWIVLLADNLFLSPAQSSTNDLSNRNTNKSLSQSNASLLVQSISPTAPLVIMKKLAGSQNSGVTVTNQENSLGCTLEKWQLIGIFKDQQIVKTQGELTFEITNNSSESQKFVLGELLFLNEQERILTVSNPHRELQGEFIKFKPPLKPGETRTYTQNIWYKSGWDKVELKTCRWLKQAKEYWDIYPELKPESKL